MKIELIFSMRASGLGVAFCDENLSLGYFRTKKAAYQYVNNNRKFFRDGYFTLCIYKNNDYFFETVRAQDILNV